MLGVKVNTMRNNTATLTKKLDRIFSKYIRQRDTQDGYGKCITCGRFMKYEDLDCGHFISRTARSTRWDEQNCHAQCRSCNRFQQGKQFEYGLAIDRKYGEGTAEQLLIKSKTTARYTAFELQELINHYKRQIQ